MNEGTSHYSTISLVHTTATGYVSYSAVNDNASSSLVSTVYGHSSTGGTHCGLAEASLARIYSYSPVALLIDVGQSVPIVFGIVASEIARLSPGNAASPAFLSVTGLINCVDAHQNVIVSSPHGLLTTAQYNAVFGYEAMYMNQISPQNTACGTQALYHINSGVGYNVGVGSGAGQHFTGGEGYNNATGTYSVFLGANTLAKADGETNEIVIGYGATGNGSNTATYGNSSITSHVFTAGAITMNGTLSLTGMSAAGFVENSSLGLLSTRTATQALGDIGASPAFALTRYYLPVVNADGTTLGSSLIQQNSAGTMVGVGVAPTLAPLQVAGTSGSVALNVGPGYVNYSGYNKSGNYYTYQAYGGWDAIGSDAANGTILALGGFRSSQWAGITLNAGATEIGRINSTGLGLGITTFSDLFTMSATIPVFSMRSSGFSHSFANNPESRANGNFSICPYAAASGGAIFSGINNNVGQPALSFFGANDNTGTLTYAPICFVSFKRSGTNTVALSATDPAFIFCNGAADWNTGTTILSMTGNGNVGINCTPLTKFHVKVTTDENFKIQGHDALTDGVTLVSGNDVANAYKSMEFSASQFDFVNGKVGIGCEPTSTLHDNGSFATKIVETSGSNNYTVLPTDYTIRCHYFSGTKYITMPSAGNFIGRILCFVGACTVTATTSVIKQADESISDAILNAGTNLFFCMMQSDGTYWQVVSRGTGL
jgi:hypothetical protein